MAGVADSYVVSAFRRTVAWLQSEAGIDRVAAEQSVAYLADARRTLGVLPTQEVLVLERFFDESGGMQLVLHAPFGSRINKAWGLALRKRFCRQFNFELQAAATEDALLLSLGPQHSFPLADVFRYLHPATARDVLVQAFLDAPVFQTRWRWNTTISLAIPRNRNGRKVPPQLQRAMADDLMAAVFPDAAACLENIPGDRQIPDHPLVAQTVRDCLHEAMDFDGLAAVLARIHAGALRLVSRDTPEPSSLAHEILNARPYAFLDDAPLEERRAQAVYTRRSSEPATADDVGALDSSAIERVRDEVRPDPRDADELHDALLTAGFFTAADAAAVPNGWLDRLIETRRAARIALGNGMAVHVWVAAERLPEILAVHPNAPIDGQATAPASRASRVWSRELAIVELLRGRLAIAGPTTASALGASLSIDPEEAAAALIALESEGAILRGSFTAGARQLEWCDRRLLARIHRYTLNRLRAEIDPVSPADFMRFLFAWQHLTPASRLTGVDGLRSVIATLDGFELAASAWERAVLPARVDGYQPSMLDTLCLAGDAGWARLSVPTPTEAAAVGRLGGTTPIALFLREHGDVWQTLRHIGDGRDQATVVEPPGQDPRHKEKTPDPFFSVGAGKVLAALRARGASFLRELAAACAMDDADAASALGELVAAGLVTSDGFAGLRAIVRASSGRPAVRDGRTSSAGRWSLLRRDDQNAPREAAVEAQAWALLRRYGVVFRRLLTREANAAPWRELARTYRRLEARGEIRGGRFVSGMSGEQFALPDAVSTLREIRRTPADGRLITISAADPLNVTGIITAGERVRAIETSRIVYRDGVPMAALQGDYLRPLAPIADAIAADVASALTGRRMPAVTSGFVGA